MPKEKKQDVRHFGMNIDAELYEKLRQIAKLEHRSVTGQVVHFVEQGINGSHVEFE